MKYVIFISLIMSIFVACAPSSAEIPQGDLSPAQVEQLLSEKESRNLFMLNVHTPYEGELEKTDAFIEDWENIKAHTDELPEDKSTPLLVYCRSGRMSTSAVSQLKDLGYTNIYHLKGGMNAWKEAGLPIVDKR